MKFFALYNYMFEKCIDTDDIFNDKERLQEVEENFARRQACFDDVLVDDYTKTQRIHFTNARGTQYLHHFLLEPFKEEGVYVLRILKNCRGTRHDENFKSIPFDDYRSCIIIIDNRPGVQAIAIENSTSAFQSLKTIENIVERTLSHVMQRRFSLKLSLKKPLQLIPLLEYCTGQKELSKWLSKGRIHMAKTQPRTPCQAIRVHTRTPQEH
jgi:hypothetical protein